MRVRTMLALMLALLVALPAMAVQRLVVVEEFTNTG